MSQQFCSKKTPEETKKEMDESTRIELEKLNLQIKANPLLLKSKLKYDSDSSSDTSTDSSSSSSSSSSNSKYKSKINRNAIDICKKEQVIDKLEEKNFFKKLELNNLMLENSQIKQENQYLALKVKEFELQSKIIIDVIEMSKNEPLKMDFSNLSNTNVNLKMMNLQKEFDSYNIKIIKAIESLNSLSDCVIKAHYNQELAKINIKLNKNFEFNNKIVNNYLIKIKNAEKCNLILLFIGITIILMAVKDYILHNLQKDYIYRI